MPQVLTTNAVILCPHGGLGTSVPSSFKWTVQGGAVLVEGDTGTLACPFAPLPCAGYTLRSMGLNASTIDGRRVILSTDFQQSLTGLPLTIAETHPALDQSTPAPLPAGGSAPPLPPALLDMVPPTVAAAPPALAFNLATQQPAVAATTFSLGSPFPREWMLTVIHEPTGQSEDATAGLPGGVVVAPPGGSWTEPALAVTVSLSAAYMATLAPGLHRFYLTGVSQRGLSSLGECILTVS